MRVEDYLNQAHRLDNRIKFKMRELDEMRETVADIRPPVLSERVQTSRQSAPPFVRALERIEEVQEKMEEEVKTLVRLKEQINSVIDSVEDSDKRTVLRCRYIHRMKWVDIGFELGIDEKTARRWCRAALDEIVLPTDAIMI